MNAKPFDLYAPPWEIYRSPSYPEVPDSFSTKPNQGGGRVIIGEVFGNKATEIVLDAVNQRERSQKALDGVRKVITHFDANYDFCEQIRYGDIRRLLEQALCADHDFTQRIPDSYPETYYLICSKCHAEKPPRAPRSPQPERDER